MHYFAENDHVFLFQKIVCHYFLLNAHFFSFEYFSICAQHAKCGGTLSIMIIIVGNGINDPSSNPGEGCFTSH